MAHYAKIVDNIVTQVIVADSDYIESLVDTSPGQWLQTSYNTREGVHSLGGTPLRKNFAGVGYSYDFMRDVFISPKPYGCNTWILDQDTCTWRPPVPYPDDGEYYKWNDSTVGWELMSEDDGWMG